MKFNEIAAALGVDEYPAVLEEYYLKRETPTFDFSLLGDHSAAAQAAVGSLSSAQNAWLETVYTYLKYNEVEIIKTVPTPETDGTPAGDYLPLLILLPLIPPALERYRARHFTEEQVQTVAETFRNAIDSTALRTGRPGYNRTYFNWQYLYIRGMLFPFGSFNYELRRLTDPVTVLQKNDGTLQPLMTEGTYHAAGMVLGSAGFEQEQGAFTADFTEDDGFFYGYPVQNGRVLPQKTAFSKGEWRIALCQGDEVISVHIPPRTDLSREAAAKSYGDGLAFIQQYYPEFQPKAYYCASWLMDPNLRPLLGDCRIVDFMEGYTHYPRLSKGNEVFNFIFPGFGGPLEDLPENTRLERALKRHYLSGQYIHAYSGVFIPEEADGKD